MSAYDTIKALCSTLNRNSEVISDSYLNRSNTLSRTADTEAVIQSLIKLRLARHFEDEEPRLAGRLVSLLEHSVRSNRHFRVGNDVGKLWNEMDGILEDYMLSKKEEEKVSFRESLESCANDLIIEIKDAIDRYAIFIERGFAFADSIEIRLQQNKRVLARADELIEMMEKSSLTKFQDATRHDPLLRRLFGRYLPKAFESSRKELRRVIAHLKELVMKVREEKALAGLIHSFQTKYESNPGYHPSEPVMINGVPSVFNIAEPLLMDSMPNVYADQHADFLANIVQSIKVLNASRPTINIDRPVELKDTRGQISEEEQSDELFEACQQSIDWLIEMREQVTASDLYERLGISEIADYELWLYAIMNTTDGLPNYIRSSIHISMEVTPSPIFSGNKLITDIKLVATGV